MAHYNEGRYTVSLKLLKELGKIASTTDERCVVLLFEALNLSDMGAGEEAIKKYETLLKYDDKRATAWSNLGILYRDRGKNDEAFNCYKKAVEYDAENAYAWNNIAQGYLAAGEWKKVIEPAERALALKANMHQAHSALTVAFFALGERDKSKKHFDLAVLHGTKAENLSAALSNLAQGCFPFDDDDRAEINDKVAQAVGFLHRDTAKAMVELRLPAPDDKNKSRIGGEAVETDVPLDSTGKPMRLLAAIWCSEVHGVPEFPESGVFIFAAMAAGGDLGASVGPQLVGIVSDLVIASERLSPIAHRLSLTPDQLGMKAGMLVGMFFPLCAIALYSTIRRQRARSGEEK